MASRRRISGSSGASVCPWAVAGAAWQGRRSCGVALPHETPRTPPGGDQRPIQGCADVPEGPLAAGERLARVAVEVRRRLPGPRAVLGLVVAAARAAVALVGRGGG